MTTTRTPAFLRRTGARLAALLVASLALAGCRGPSEAEYAPAFTDRPDTAPMPEYVLAVHPLHNPKKLFETYQPLVDHLNTRVPGVRLRLEASSSYADFERKLAARQVAFALPNPYQTLQSLQHGYRVFAKMGDDADFRGVILVRRDSGIRNPRDLAGKAMSFPAPTALAAAMLPQWYLHANGLDVRRELKAVYVGSQESSIMNVAMGRTAAGATWPPPWRAFQKTHPELAAMLEVRWQTEPLLNNALVARDDVPTATVDAVRTQLLALSDGPEGRAILARMELARFEAASDLTYRPVARFVERFERELRPVEAAP